MNLQKQGVKATARAENCLRFLPHNALSVGIVGTGAELLAQEYRSINPVGNVTCTPDPAALNDDPTHSFESLLFLGCSAQTQSLKGILKHAKTVISGSGVCILEIKNPLFFKLLPGQKWESTALEKQWAHTKKNILDGLGDSGFFVDQTRISRSSVQEFGAWMDGYAIQSGLSPQMKKLLCAPFFLYRLTPNPVSRLQIQAKVLKPVGGVNDVRINEPLRAMASLPGVTCHASRQVVLKPQPANVDKIILLHRPILKIEPALAEIQKMREAGYLIITEFDDYPSLWPEIEKNGYLSFRGVHAVQTTTPELAKYFREFNPTVKIFANQLDRLPSEHQKSSEAPVRLFFGAINRGDDWRPIMPSLNKALSEAKASYWVDVVMDREFYEALETDQKTFTPLCHYDLYKSHLRQADIVLIPLQDTTFNRMKSDLKFVEAAGHGAVPIASAVVYPACDPEGEFSIICHQDEAFGEAVAELLNNTEKRQRLQKNGVQYVRKNRLLSLHLTERENWYRGLLKDIEKLDDALAERLTHFAR
ncbi:glycosyltransferase family protein [Sneathiella aquimaris]|uniref:hypothetical protein n=1 Tax=Sneathiella aquimaris TaxID=2599305 RepID=UPI00146BCEB9|nr:hypothetical protein [Sneathiella aquimaris]